MKKPETIKKVLVAGRLTRLEYGNHTIVRLSDRHLLTAEVIDIEKTPEEVPTSIKGAIDILINEEGCEVDIAQTYEKAKEMLKDPKKYDNVLIDAFLPTSDEEVGRKAFEQIHSLGRRDEYKRWPVSDEELRGGMRIAGILLASEIADEFRNKGVILNTELPRVASKEAKPNEDEIEYKADYFQRSGIFRANGISAGYFGWLWIDNCDSCAVAALLCQDRCPETGRFYD
jgi:hypothetical protein